MPGNVPGKFAIEIQLENIFDLLIWEFPPAKYGEMWDDVMIMLDWILLHSALPASLYMESDHPGPRENYHWGEGGRVTRSVAK